MNPLPHFLEEKLIDCVDKAKNLWIIVSQLPIKAGWWDAPSGSRVLAEAELVFHTTRTAKLGFYLSHNWSLIIRSQNQNWQAYLYYVLLWMELESPGLNSAVLIPRPQICSKDSISQQSIPNTKFLECHPAGISFQHTFVTKFHTYSLE